MLKMTEQEFETDNPDVKGRADQDEQLFMEGSGHLQI